MLPSQHEYFLARHMEDPTTVTVQKITNTTHRLPRGRVCPPRNTPRTGREESRIARHNKRKQRKQINNKQTNNEKV